MSLGLTLYTASMVSLQNWILTCPMCLSETTSRTCTVTALQTWSLDLAKQVSVAHTPTTYLCYFHIESPDGKHSSSHRLGQ